MRILYDSKKIEYKKPFGAIKADEVCVVSIKIPIDCITNECLLIIKNEEGLQLEVPLNLVTSENYYKK